MKMPQLFAIAGIQCLSAAAFGQESLGEVLDQSGQLLTPDSIKAELVGHWINWQSKNSLLEFQAKPNDDGSLQGRVRNFRGTTGELSGTWRIKDDGRFCMSAKYLVGPSHPGDFDICHYWFKVGAKYWSGSSNSDRDATVVKRSVSQ